MIRLTLPAEAPPRLRLALSPTWEAVGALGVLFRSHGRPAFRYRVWERIVMRRLGPARLKELHAAARAGRLFDLPQPGLPFPTPGLGTFARELVQLQARGSAEAAALAELLEASWPILVEPWWDQILQALETALLTLGRTLATEGPEAFLTGLDGRIHLRPPVMMVPAQADIAFDARDAEIVLVPMVFAGAIRLVATSPVDATVPAIAMSFAATPPVMLQSTLPQRNRERRPDRVGLLLGSGRASVLSALVVPMTTTALARATGLAASTVSEHLSTLHAAGLLRRHRIGRNVYYELDRAGYRLLASLTD